MKVQESRYIVYGSVWPSATRLRKPNRSREISRRDPSVIDGPARDPFASQTESAAVSWTSLPAFSAARTVTRSEKQIEKIRPVSATAARSRATWSSVVAPGLSIITSLPWRIASIVMSARSTLTAALQTTAIVSSANTSSPVSTGTSGQVLAMPSTIRGEAPSETWPANSAPASSRPSIWSKMWK